MLSHKFIFSRYLNHVDFYYHVMFIHVDPNDIFRRVFQNATFVRDILYFVALICIITRYYS